MIKDAIDDLLADWCEQRPDLDSESVGVVLRIQALAKTLAEQTAKRLQDFDLQWWQYDVLSALRRQGKPYVMSASELAEAAMLTSGAMTNRIDRLVESKLVCRLDDSSDRRKVLVKLTAQGLDRIEDATRARFESATVALTGLDKQQKKALSSLLRQVLANQ